MQVVTDITSEDEGRSTILLPPEVQELINQRVLMIIPFPSQLPRGKGIHGTGRKDTAFHTYCSREEHDLIASAADHIGLSRNSFIRWCALKTAQGIMSYVERTSEPEQPDG